jgi:hypothetical protein
MDTIEPIAEFETWWSEAVEKALADCDAKALTDAGQEIDLKTMMQLGTSATRKRYSPETRMQAYYCILYAFALNARDDVYVSIARYRADIFHFWKDKEPSSKRRFFPWKSKKTAPTEEVDPNPWRLAEIIHIEWCICDWRMRLDDALDTYKRTDGFNSLKTMMDAGSADTVDEYEESYRREACRIIRDHVVSSAPKYVSETITTVGDAYISGAEVKKAEETEPAVWFANPWRVRDRAAYTWRWFPQGLVTGFLSLLSSTFLLMIVIENHPRERRRWWWTRRIRWMGTAPVSEIAT